MKKYLLTFTVVALLSFTGNLSFAKGGNDAFGLNSPSQVQKMETAGTQAAVNKQKSQEQRLQTIKKRADKMIEDRLSEANKLLMLIGQNQKLSTDEKTSLSKEIQAVIAGLNLLKTKVDADTNVSDALADAKQIIANYKIFAMFVPKIRLTITIDNLQALAGKLQDLSSKLQTLIDNLKSEGKETINLQSLLDDINARLKTLISVSLTNDKTILVAVSVSTSNPQNIFTQVRKDLARIRVDFAKIRHDLALMRKSLPSPLPSAKQ